MSVVYSPVLNYSNGVLRKSQEMDSNISHQQQQQHCHQQNSELLRYRSAPSSFLASLVDTNTTGGCVNEEAFRSEGPQRYHLPSTSSEMETMFPKLISPNNGLWSNSEHVQELFGGKPVKQEEAGKCVPKEPQQNGYSYGSQLIYQSQQIQGLPNDSSSGAAAASAFDGSFGVVNSNSSDHSTQSKMGVRSCSNSNLIRQKSSPAGFFSNENGMPFLLLAKNYRNFFYTSFLPVVVIYLGMKSISKPTSDKWIAEVITLRSLCS